MIRLTKMKTCKFTDCNNKHDSHEYCANHARQFRKYGHPLSKEEVSTSKRLNRSKSRGNLGHKWTEEAKIARSVVTKGKQLNTGRTHFKKGDTRLIGNKNAEGRTPWNKGKSGVMPPAWNKGTTGLMPRPHNKIGNGVTAQSKLERARFRRVTQMLVFQRDNYTCQGCDQYSGNLQVDHIKKWSNYPELRFDVNNCRTLCMACHYYVTFKRKIPKGIVWGHNLSRRIV